MLQQTEINAKKIFSHNNPPESAAFARAHILKHDTAPRGKSKLDKKKGAEKKSENKCCMWFAATNCHIYSYCMRPCVVRCRHFQAATLAISHFAAAAVHFRWRSQPSLPPLRFGFNALALFMAVGARRGMSHIVRVS